MAERTFYTTGLVRAKDLVAKDIVRLDGVWMYAIGAAIDKPDDAEEYRKGYTSDVKELFNVARFIESAPEQTVLIHLINDHDSDINDVVHLFRIYMEYDLVEIQVPITKEQQ